jgi:hypothetical protein
VHVGVPHDALDVAKWQATTSVPSHDIPQPGSGGVVVAAHAWRGEPVDKRGAPTTGTQVPTLPDSAHAWQLPVHA